LRLTSLAQWLPSYSSTLSTSSQLQVEYKPSLKADQLVSVAAQLLIIQPASGIIQANLLTVQILERLTHNSRINGDLGP
jgi:hypothetical protein